MVEKSATAAVLVADDEQAIRLALQRALGAAGFDVGVAVNGEDALAQMEERQWDLVLLDMRMPGIDGLEVLRQLRGQRSNVPVIMITAYGSVPTAIEAMKLGAVDYLEKPFTNQQIVGLINKVLQRSDLDEDVVADDPTLLLEMAKKHIQAREFQAAAASLRKVVSIDPASPEPFNLLGVLHEIRGEVAQAQKMYRAALSLDPTYRAADNNLMRTVGATKGQVDLGQTEPPESAPKER